MNYGTFKNQWEEKMDDYINWWGNWNVRWLGGGIYFLLEAIFSFLEKISTMYNLYR